MRGTRRGSRTDKAKGLAYARLATRTAPSFAQFWRTLGYLSLQFDAGLATRAQALGAFQRALSLDRNDSRSRRTVVAIHLNNREYAAAAEHLAYLFRKAPLSFTEKQVHQFTATLITADLFAWGADLYARAFATDPQRHDFAIGQAILLKAQGDSARAVEILQRTLAESQRHGEVARALLAHWSRR